MASVTCIVILHRLNFKHRPIFISKTKIHVSEYDMITVLSQTETFSDFFKIVALTSTHIFTCILLIQCVS